MPPAVNKASEAVLDRRDLPSPQPINNRFRWRAIYRGSRNHRWQEDLVRPNPCHQRALRRFAAHSRCKHLQRKLRASTILKSRSLMSSSTMLIRLARQSPFNRPPDSANLAFLYFQVGELALTQSRIELPKTLVDKSFLVSRVTSN